MADPPGRHRRRGLCGLHPWVLLRHGAKGGDRLYCSGINIRTLTFETAQAVLRAAVRLKVGPVIFEIARSEIDYTCQRPEEFTAAVTAAAIKTGYEGPLFLQGDHFQINAGKYEKDPIQEVQAVKDLIWEAIEAGFYNIDVDTSTLVDLARPTIKEQQQLNYTLAAELTTMIRIWNRWA